MNPTDDTACGFTRRQLARALHRVRADWRAFAICVAVSFVPTAAIDLSTGEGPSTWPSVATSFVHLYLTLRLTFRTLAAEGEIPPGYDPRRPTDGRYPANYLLNLLFLLGVIAGLIAFVVPGVALYLLWSVALPALASERISVIDAMRRSWTLTRPALGRVALLAAAIALLVLLLMLAAATCMTLAPEWGPPLIVALDLAMSVTLMFSPIVWTYAYLALRPDPA